jgi:hypothetical protein
MKGPFRDVLLRVDDRDVLAALDVNPVVAFAADWVEFPTIGFEEFDE